jgi:hypothetical protein
MVIGARAAREAALEAENKMLLGALRAAWQELNTIKARDGVAYQHDIWSTPYTTEEYWAELVERCDAAIQAATGEPPKPWPFAWERDAEALG